MASTRVDRDFLLVCLFSVCANHTERSLERHFPRERRPPVGSDARRCPMAHWRPIR